MSETEVKPIAVAHKRYEPALDFALRRPIPVIGGGLAVFAVALAPDELHVDDPTLDHAVQAERAVLALGLAVEADDAGGADFEKCRA